MDIKRLFAWAIIALPLFAACDEEDKITTEEGGEGSVEVTMKALAGEWYLNLPDISETEERSLVIKADGSFVMQETYSFDSQIHSQFRIEGKYKLNGTTLVGEVSKSQFRSAKWNNNQYAGLGEWEDYEYYDFADTAQVSLLKDGSVLLIKSNYYGSEQASFYFKKGSKLPSDKSVLQGTWFWMDEFKDQGRDVVRVAVKFDGDNIDLIVVPWSQRFICKYEYKDGVVTSKGEVTFRTLFKENGANEMNYSNPYDSEWLPTYDPKQYTGNLSDGFSFPIFVDGKTAYSEFIGLTPIYQKQ